MFWLQLEILKQKKQHGIFSSVLNSIFHFDTCRIQHICGEI
jgi:hypothetical protein